MQLSEVQVRCLLKILQYSMLEEIRSLDIANDMNVSKSVTHKRLKTLIALDLITKRKYGRIMFTHQGFEVAKELQRKYNAIFPFFENILNLEQGDAREATLIFIGKFSNRCIQELQDYVISLTTANEN